MGGLSTYDSSVAAPKSKIDGLSFTDAAPEMIIHGAIVLDFPGDFGHYPSKYAVFVFGLKLVVA